MIQNDLRIALRSLRKQRGYAAINVLGLAVGIAGALLVGLFVRGEFQFDRFHANADRTYRAHVREVYGPDQVFHNTVTPIPLGPALAATFPEVERTTRFQPRDGTLRHGPDAFAETVAFADLSFFDVFSLPAVAGDLATALDRPDALVLTDSAATRLFGAESPLGRPVVVRLGPGPLPEAMAAVERAFASVAPDRPFEYQFVNDVLDAQYREEARLGRIVTLASWLAVFVAALGLFGLAALTAAQRTKEIGVRKVLGASSARVVALLSKDLARLVVVGFVVAVPVAWWLMRGWLDDFAYRIALSPWLFVAAGALALLVALLTTAFHAVRAAAADPVWALHSE